MTKTKEFKPVVGRRKTAVAQAKLVPAGKGDITVNQKPLADYFRGCDRLMTTASSPVGTVADGKTYDYTVKVNGGGIAGQAGAVRHAISRTLSLLSLENRQLLKKAGFLTRDPRMVERKKPGQPKARKRFQFSKR